MPIKAYKEIFDIYCMEDHLSLSDLTPEKIEQMARDGYMQKVDKQGRKIVQLIIQFIKFRGRATGSLLLSYQELGELYHENIKQLVHNGFRIHKVKMKHKNETNVFFQYIITWGNSDKDLNMQPIVNMVWGEDFIVLDQREI